jgi:hypothetical protein
LKPLAISACPRVGPSLRARKKALAIANRDYSKMEFPIGYVQSLFSRAIDGQCVRPPKKSLGA